MSSHEFDLAFNLLDEAATRLHARRYGTSRITDHNQGHALLTSVHRYTRAAGHHLTLFAADTHGQAAVVDAYAPNLRSEPALRIRTVRVAHLTFHAGTGSWTFRAQGRHHYTLTARAGDCAWALTIDNHPTTFHDSIDAAVAAVLDHEPARRNRPTRSRR